MSRVGEPRGRAAPAVGVRAARPDDADRLCAFRCALWPEGSAVEHARELAAFFAGEGRRTLEVFVAVDGTGRPIGFCEVALRPSAEGCGTAPVGYLEGWYVEPEARRRGAGRALVRAAEAWARAQGCSEMASDADPDNRASAAAHAAVGFADAGLVRCFRKDL